MGRGARLYRRRLGLPRRRARGRRRPARARRRVTSLGTKGAIGVHESFVNQGFSKYGRRTHGTRIVQITFPDAFRAAGPVMRRLTLVPFVVSLVACGQSSTSPTPVAVPQPPAFTIPCDLVGTLPCQTPPPPVPAPHVATDATVSGTVTDGTSGGVLPGLRVTSSDARAALTDATGRFAFAHVALGPLTLSISATSYVTTTRTVTVGADATVDIVLPRVPGATPPPTPPPPASPRPTLPGAPAHGGVRADLIQGAHALIFGSPIPTTNQNGFYQRWPYPVTHAGQFDYALTEFPLGLYPSGGASNTISASEMLFAAVQVPGASAVYTWHRVTDVDTVIFTSAGSYSYIGHFLHEINGPGWYYLTIDTDYGRVTVDYLMH